MILAQHDIEVILHHRNGGEVASRRKDQPDEPFEVDIDPVWNFQAYEYEKHGESTYMYLLSNDGKDIGASTDLAKVMIAVKARKNPSDQISKYKRVWTKPANSLPNHGM